MTRRFEEGIGAFAWSAVHTQIYPELARLLAEGLVEVVSVGPRGRRVHDVTASGRHALREWLLGPHTDGGTVRNEFVLRLFLLSALDEQDARHLLAGVGAHATERIALLEGEQQALARAGAPSGHPANLAAQFGILSYLAARDWASWAAGQLENRGGRAAASR